MRKKTFGAAGVGIGLRMGLGAWGSKKKGKQTSTGSGFFPFLLFPLSTRQADRCRKGH